MKKYILMLGAAVLFGFGTAVNAADNGTGHTVDVTTDDWGDDDDTKLNFNFEDIPTATFEDKELKLSCELPEAKIYYSIKPLTLASLPSRSDTTTWTLYTEPLNLTYDCTVSFFGRCEGYNDSEIITFDFIFSNYQVAAPVIATDMDRKNLVITTDTPDATIRYTLDGSEPTDQSTLYEGPFIITTNGLYRARAYAEGKFDSEITDYLIDFLTASTPSASFSNKTLTLSIDDQSTDIFYTTDTETGPDKIEAWTKYTAPIALTTDCTVRYFGRRQGYNDSEIQSFGFVYAAYQVATPLLSATEDGNHVKMECETEGASIHYTIDGSEPTQQSTLYSTPVEIASNGVFRTRAFRQDLFESNIAEFTVMHLGVPVPVASFENLTVVLTCADEKATILYTTDSEASKDEEGTWSVYTKPLALTENSTVRFYGRREGYNDSDVQSFVFVYSNYQVADPTIERNEAGTHLVIATTTPGARIHYTSDGTEPTSASTLYTEPILIESNGTFSAIAVADGFFDSKVNRYVISNMAVPNPSANFANKKFTLTCSDPKAQIWYTTENSATPDNIAGWTLYTAPFELKSDCTLRFFSRRENLNDSDIESLTFVLSAYQVQAPTIARNAQGTHVVMTAPVENATIYYTTDGSEPTGNSTLYQQPVRIQSSVTYRARVVDSNLYDSEITVYEIGDAKLTAPTATYKNFELVLSTPDKDASIWYTFNANLSVDNVNEWTMYEKPLKLTEDTVIRFFAGDDDANASDVQTFVYQRTDYQVAPPTIERNEPGTHVVMACQTDGASIRYTTDGSEPGAESALYKEPILIESNGTFRAKAFVDGLYDSEITDFVVSNIAVPVPSASFVNKRLVLTCSDPKAAIWFTTKDNATPENMADWTLYTAPVELIENCTVHFFTRRENFNDSDIESFVFVRANYQAVAPVIDRSEDGRSIVMSTETENAEIRYTTDGTEPTEASELYTDPVFITMNCTFRAKAFAPGLFESETVDYVISHMTMMMPHATFEKKHLTLSVWDDAASIWYTTDPEAVPEKAEAWTLYTEPIELNEDCTVRFFARRTGFLDSNIATYEFVYADHQASVPVIEYDEDKNVVTLSCPTENVDLRYTLDGTDPSVESTLYTAPFTISQKCTIKVRAFSSDLIDSEIVSQLLNYIVGASDIVSDGTSLSVYKDGPNLVIDSSDEIHLHIYTIGGRLVRTVSVNAGHNVVTGLAKGVYVVTGVKIIL